MTPVSCTRNWFLRRGQGLMQPLYSFQGASSPGWHRSSARRPVRFQAPETIQPGALQRSKYHNLHTHTHTHLRHIVVQFDTPRPTESSRTQDGHVPYLQGFYDIPLPLQLITVALRCWRTVILDFLFSKLGVVTLRTGFHDQKAKTSRYYSAKTSGRDEFETAKRIRSAQSSRKLSQHIATHHRSFSTKSATSLAWKCRIKDL